MPAESKAQRKVTAIALHAPEKLYDRNKGLAKMKKTDLEDFASTSEKNLPYKKSSKPAMGRGGVGKKGSRKSRRMGRSGGNRY